MSTPIPEDKLSVIKEMLFQGRKIEAIKIFRKSSGAGLAEVKEQLSNWKCNCDRQSRKNSLHLLSVQVAWG